MNREQLQTKLHEMFDRLGQLHFAQLELQNNHESALAAIAAERQATLHELVNIRGALQLTEAPPAAAAAAPAPAPALEAVR